MTDAAAGGAAGPFDLLLEVQDLDTRITQLQHRRTALAERSGLVDAMADVAAVDGRAAELGSARQALLDRQAELEQQIGALNTRRQAIEDRMQAERGASRDLVAMDEEVHHLVLRRADLEEVELALMEEQEPLDAELAELAARRVPLAERVAALEAEVATESAAIEAELRGAEAARGAAARGLPTDLADRYETLRARLKGTGAARLVGNRCDGCHLELPSVEVERIRQLPPDAVVTCDQCGRILVRPHA